MLSDNRIELNCSEIIARMWGTLIGDLRHWTERPDYVEAIRDVEKFIEALGEEWAKEMDDMMQRFKEAGFFNGEQKLN